MATFRILMASAIVGAFFGVVIASLVAPSLISSSLCGMTSDVLTSRPCLDTVKHTIDSLLHGQMIGAAIGASTGLALAIAWRSGKGTTPKAPPTSPAGTPSAASPAAAKSGTSA